MKYYAGIGSRETPEQILTVMTGLGYSLAKAGFVLRSGHAPGADQAFEYGAKVAFPEAKVPAHDIFLPWDGFEQGSIELPGFQLGVTPKTMEIAERFHPRWSSLKQGAKRLHARNVCQILGYNAEGPTSSFVVCWTEDGRASGGTGQALRIAKEAKIPIFNLFDPAVLFRLEAYVS